MFIEFFEKLYQNIIVFFIKPKEMSANTSIATNFTNYGLAFD